MPDTGEFANVLFEYSIIMDSIDDAEDLFVLAEKRLLDVNHWHQTAPGINGLFTLADKNGAAINRKAHKHDRIRVSTSDNTVQLSVQSIVYDDYPDTSEECFSMELQPVLKGSSQYPFETGPFTIAIERHSAGVAAVIKGQNETDTHFQNQFIKGLQWVELLKGLLNTDED